MSYPQAGPAGQPTVLIHFGYTGSRTDRPAQALPGWLSATLTAIALKDTCSQADHHPNPLACLALGGVPDEARGRLGGGALRHYSQIRYRSSQSQKSGQESSTPGDAHAAGR